MLHCTQYFEIFNGILKSFLKVQNLNVYLKYICIFRLTVLYESFIFYFSRIVGPRCILTCLIGGFPVPTGQSPIFTVGMRDIIVTTTNCNEDLKVSFVTFSFVLFSLLIFLELIKTFYKKNLRELVILLFFSLLTMMKSVWF